jgi:hypothetical protein
LPELHDLELQLDRIVDTPIDPVPPPEALYHYTTLDALAGIARSCRLRLFDATSMADKSELRAVRPIIEDAVRRELTRGRSRRETNALLWLLAHAQRQLFEVADVYLGCFTAERDSLPHWIKFGAKDTPKALASASVFCPGQRRLGSQFSLVGAFYVCCTIPRNAMPS